MLGAQSERLDRQFLARRSWPYRAWRERYLDHPLVGTLAHRLLWTVDGTTCGYAEGELRGQDDEPVTDGTGVELWHPVGKDAADVVRWRLWLERHAITQPFKQAHREVHPLTDAERTTGTYSNRFAGHILRLAPVPLARGRQRLDEQAQTLRGRLLHPPPTVSFPSGGCAPSTGSTVRARAGARARPPSPAAICGWPPTRSSSIRSTPRTTTRTQAAGATRCG
ncbi:DUF4132 domain-containing protein [Streptomyces sp. NPDC051098]|uniref:DUF4132 domain-containing protein n=1 Tax=Streptomyces sp. NPDC051098 TaxID=3155411 RepID=UPI0034335052